MLLRDMVDSNEKAGDRNTTAGSIAPSIPEDVMWYVIESKVLDNERVLLVMKKKYLKQARKEHPDKAIYFPPEIRELARHEGYEKFDDLVRKVHMVKKEFRAWIVPSNNKEGGQQNGKAKAQGL